MFLKMPVEADDLSLPMSYIFGLIEDLQGPFPAAAAGNSRHKGQPPMSFKRLTISRADSAAA